MRINNLTGTAFVASVASAAGATSACTTEVELISASAPLSTLVKCASKLSVIDGTTSAQYIALYEGCVTALANKVGSGFPAVPTGGATGCRSCYSSFAADVAAIMVGSVSPSDTFTPATGAVAACKTLATASEVDECFKNIKLVETMITFHSCAGHAINYPANASLARERALYRAGAFVELTQNAFGSTTEMPDILQDVIAHNGLDGAIIQTGAELHLDICLLKYHTELKLYTRGTPVQAIVDACETIVADDTTCADSVPVSVALSNFTECSGSDMQVLPGACTADQSAAMSAMGAYAKIVDCIFNGNSASTDCANDRAVLNAALVVGAGADCGACYAELGTDLQSSFDNGTSYGTNCVDPYSSDCKIRTGSAPVTNFKECSGIALDRTAPAAATTTASPTTAAATAAATTAAPASTAAPTTKGSSITALTLLAAGLALVL